MKSQVSSIEGGLLNGYPAPETNTSAIEADVSGQDSLDNAYPAP